MTDWQKIAEHEAELAWGREETKEDAMNDVQTLRSFQNRLVLARIEADRTAKVMKDTLAIELVNVRVESIAGVIEEMESWKQ
jgi:hypothetical protein